MSRQPDTERKVRVVLTGGGTAGHVYPALAVLRILEARGRVSEALYLGVGGRAEERIVPRQGVRFETVPSAPVAGGSRLERLWALVVVGAGTLVAAAKLVRFRPRLVIATGGYVAAPVVFAAWLLRRFLRLEIVLHEQNLVPGALNQAASLMADLVLVSHRESAFFVWSRRTLFAGYPVRSVYREDRDRASAREGLGLSPSDRLLLVYGGSLGARSINRSLAAVLDELSVRDDLTVVHVVGSTKSPSYDALGETREVLAQRLGSRFDPEAFVARRPDGRVFYRGFEYCHDLVEYQRAADLVVCRAGAGSLAESIALGVPTVLVPKRGLPGDHQELNAIAVAERGAAAVVFERRENDVDSVSPAELAGIVLDLLADDERRVALGEGARALQEGEADDRIGNAVEELLAGRPITYAAAVREPRFVRFRRQFDALVLYLETAEERGLFHQLYDLKAEELMASSRWQQVNKGIKLVGALRRRDLYPLIYERFHGWRGFQRRNALAALRKAEVFEGEMASLALAGIRDSYYEVRREALALVGHFADALATGDPPRSEEASALVRAVLHRRFESFEVQAEAIRVAVRLLPEADFYHEAERFLAARTVRLREAILDALEVGLATGRLRDRVALRRTLGRLFVTSSEFVPRFRLRERYLRVVELMERSS